jgi:chitinase
MTTLSFRALVSAMLLAGLVSFSAPPAHAAGSKRLLSYYTSWSKSQSPSYSADQIPYQKMTHISHAFLLLDVVADGSLFVPPELLEPALISKAHAAGVKVLISIGGAGEAQSAAFAAVASREDLRRAFARNVKAFVTANGYDGVDVDWEVPFAPQDTEPCVLLMRALRDELPAPQFLISMAIPSNPRGWGTGFDVPTLAPILDFINVMTYDLHGPWTDHAGHNSPLEQSSKDPGGEGSLVASMDLFEKTYGVPKEKLNIGTAFYGYEFDGTSRLWGRCGCGQNTASRDFGSYIKPRIDALGWKAYVDKSAKAPYLQRETGAGIITYDDAKSTKRKVNYVLGTRDMGGVFMWEVSGDYDGRSQDLLNAMFKAFSKYE